MRFRRAFRRVRLEKKHPFFAVFPFYSDSLPCIEVLHFEIADCVSVTKREGKVKQIPLGRSNGRDCRRAVHCGSPRRRRDGRTQSERERRAEGAADGNIGCVARPRGRRGRFRRVASRLVLNVVALNILTRSSLPLHLLLDPRERRDAEREQVPLVQAQTG